MPDGPARVLDTIGWFIATLHSMIGHYKTAAVLGEEPLDTASCILCQYDKGEATKAEVIERIGVSR